MNSKRKRKSNPKLTPSTVTVEQVRNLKRLWRSTPYHSLPPYSCDVQHVGRHSIQFARPITNTNRVGIRWLAKQLSNPPEYFNLFLTKRAACVSVVQRCQRRVESARWDVRYQLKKLAVAKNRLKRTESGK